MPDVAACSYCGSGRVYPRIWVQGFLPTINDDRQTYVCRDCGRDGILLRFDSEEDRAKYAEERRQGAAPESPKRKAAESIPILPIDAVPLLEVRGVDAIPIYRTKVVDVQWTDRRLRRGGYRADLDLYWAIVGGPRYNAGSVFVLDLGGVNHGSPSFDAVRTIAKHTSVLFDLGAHHPEEVMDGFMVDVDSVVVGTKTLKSLQQFQEIHDLSEGVIPCIDVADGVVWSDVSKEETDLAAVASALRGIGFPTLAVMDVRRLGTFQGPDPELVRTLSGLGGDLLFGGGVCEEDVSSLHEAGISRALVDPFTPVIRALLPTREEPVPEKATPAERPVRDVRSTPAPG